IVETIAPRPCPVTGRILYWHTRGHWTSVEPQPESAPRPPADLPPTRTPRPVGPAHGTARLTLTVNGTDYRVRPLAVEDLGCGVRRAFRLRKEGGMDAHTVCELIEGPVSCDCGDYVWRRDGQRELGPCKHGAALVVLGLLKHRARRPVPALA